MRRISEQAAAMLLAGKNFEKDNTVVKDGSMYLFDNKIAWTDQNGCLWVRTAGWSSNTTLDRLRALGADVKKRKGKLFLFGVEWDGKLTKIHEINIKAWFLNARDGFTHKAELSVDGFPYADSRAHYLNRTWESYEFQSVKKSVVEKAIKRAKKEKDAVLVGQLEQLYTTL